jgi:hypothetical protein
VNSFVSVVLILVSCIFTFVRLRTILRQGVQRAGDVTLNIWAMLLCFSICIGFMLPQFIAFFDARTFPSLSVLIANCAFLASQYFGMAGIIAGMEIPTGQQIIRWMRLFLVAELCILFVFYVFFVSKVQAISFFVPHSIPEAIFTVIVCFLAIIMCIILLTTALLYLPSKKFALMRLRTILFALCIFTSAIYLLFRAIIFGSYVWPFLMFPTLVPLSYLFLISATLLFFVIFLNDGVYAQFFVLLRSIESWHTFKDLQSLVERLLLLCPVIGLPADNPPFWRFFFNPEYYLYRAVIIILDSKAMLSDFLAQAEFMQADTPPLWGDDLLKEAIQVNQALQSANPSNDFSDIVETYRRISQDLFNNQNYAL